MNLILAADQNWGIGFKGKLLAHISDDMKFFKRMTTGNVIIVGRKTLESFPGGKPLVDRVNIVLSQNKNYDTTGIVLCNDLDCLKKELEKYKDKDVFVVGGGTIYRQLLPYCNKAYVTRLLECFEADTHMIPLDKDPQWQLSYESPVCEANGVPYKFTEYTRVL